MDPENEAPLEKENSFSETILYCFFLVLLFYVNLWECFLGEMDLSMSQNQAFFEWEPTKKH